MNETFARYAQNRHEEAKKWKQETGKEVFGYFCCMTPDEILYAADVLPVRITGTGEPIERADAHMPPNACPFARSCLDAGMRGIYDYIDGVVVPNTCDVIFSMEYFWKTLVPRPNKPALIAGVDIKPYVYYINAPVRIIGKDVVPYYLEVLKNFKQELERALGRTISDEGLSRAISVYNEDKAQIKRMYDMRKSNPSAVSGYDAWQAVYASLLMPKDEHATLLNEYLDEIRSSGKTARDGVRIYLSGSAMDLVNADIYKIIEESGGQVISDDLCVGSRSFWYTLNSDLPPLEAIARRSLGTACPRSMVNAPIQENRWTHMLNTTKDFGIEGAIFWVLKCCDGRNAEIPHLRDKFKAELGIPVLVIEIDYTREGNEQIRGRVEAFIEMIEG